MKKGEIWLINLDPTIGAEISKTRPALILNEDGFGKLPLRIVAPITAWRDRYRLAEWMVFVPSDDTSGLDKNSTVDCFQTRSVDERRMVRRIGQATPEVMEKVGESLTAVLDL